MKDENLRLKEGWPHMVVSKFMELNTHKSQYQLSINTATQTLYKFIYNITNGILMGR